MTEYMWEFTVVDPAGKETFVISGTTTEPAAIEVTRDHVGGHFGIRVPRAESIGYMKSGIEPKNHRTSKGSK